jgi:predicted alpha/beta-fold hydrolase
VAPRLRQLHVPSLLAVSRHDPIVSIGDIEASLGEANPLLEVRRLGTGGHVGFPPWLDLGEDAPGGLERQVLRWLERRLR